MHVPKANHFAKRKPTVVLLAMPDRPLSALADDDGKPIVFKNWSKASKHVSRFIEPHYHPFIQYVNEEPEAGAGDREETNHRRCLKCNGFLRPSNTLKSVGGDDVTMTVETLVCPVCDKE